METKNMLYLVTEYAKNGEIFGECLINLFIYLFPLKGLPRHSWKFSVSLACASFRSCTRLHMQSLCHLLAQGVDPPTGLPIL